MHAAFKDVTCLKKHSQYYGHGVQTRALWKFVFQNIVVCLFSWRYNPLWLYFHSPVVGFSLLVFEVS
jgi:hypothetical protein